MSSRDRQFLRIVQDVRPTSNVLSGNPRFLEDFRDITRVLGREYFDIDLTQVLEAPNADDLLLDLAITISRRGLVVFRNQKNLTPAQQKYFTNHLGQLTGNPDTSGVHVHPINHTVHKAGEKPDLEMSTIARNPNHMLSKQTGVTGGKKQLKKQSVAGGWHSDIAFERVTSDYTTLINRVQPSTDGDTIFASAYEVYDRIGLSMRAFLETLTGTFSPVGCNPNPEHTHLHQVARGYPLNGLICEEATPNQAVGSTRVLVVYDSCMHLVSRGRG
ncbi:uncharacterized protein BDW43DRAFT_307265 [Aspergillus alliaceus]|uniref:uncharacterized protein n=1 Tax=Petromyces alliaceus TaxID=209559 RepID=UPI0012A4516F|nr:uncharacterized protein BDW43DRAFT_307265 [Aspergillus alliaceus]KAB8237751.1 hypothetical protein BDW43DRAFT_307265 [Aspergillus alliaceus]